MSNLSAVKRAYLSSGCSNVCTKLKAIHLTVVEIFECELSRYSALIFLYTRESFFQILTQIWRRGFCWLDQQPAVCLRDPRLMEYTTELSLSKKNLKYEISFAKVTINCENFLLALCFCNKTGNTDGLCASHKFPADVSVIFFISKWRNVLSEAEPTELHLATKSFTVLQFITEHCKTLCLY